jgi:hypothetical protein
MHTQSPQGPITAPVCNMQCNIPGLSNTLASHGHAVPARSTLTDEDVAAVRAVSKSVILPARSCIVAFYGRCYGFQRSGCVSPTITLFSDGCPRSPAVMVGSTNLLEAFWKMRWKPPTCLIGIGKVLACWLQCAVAVRLCLCHAGGSACHNGAPLFGPAKLGRRRVGSGLQGEHSHNATTGRCGLSLLVAMVPSGTVSRFDLLSPSVFSALHTFSKVPQSVTSPPPTPRISASQSPCQNFETFQKTKRVDPAKVRTCGVHLSYYRPLIPTGFVESWLECKLLSFSYS